MSQKKPTTRENEEKVGGHHLLQLLKHCHFAYGVKILHIIKLLIIRCYDLCNLMHLYIHVDTGHHWPMAFKTTKTMDDLFAFWQWCRD